MSSPFLLSKGRITRSRSARIAGFDRPSQVRLSTFVIRGFLPVTNVNHLLPNEVALARNLGLAGVCPGSNFKTATAHAMQLEDTRL